MDFDLKLSLISKIPLVDYELQPKAQLIRKDLSTSKQIKKDFPKLPDYSLKWTWYKSKEKVVVTCCVHHCKIATVQCIDCVKCKLSVEESYNCSMECFRDNWKNHRLRHPTASADDIKTKIADDEIDSCYSNGSWHSFVSAFESGSNSSGTSTEGGESWTEIGSSETYKPTSHDFGYKLKLECVAVDSDELPLTPTEVILTDSVIITPAPRLREMIPVGSLGCFSNSSSETQPCLAETFSILTYNVLADYCVNESLYPYCVKWALTWPYRQQILLQEIIRYNADIVCLQEVQTEHFENFFKPELEKLGYSVSYKTKTSGVFTGTFQTDGCATFFRDKFIEIRTEEIEFRKLAILAHETLSQQQKKIMESYPVAKDNVAVIVLLKLKDNDKATVFCVANTHIHADPKAKHVKLWQVATLINNLEKVYDSNIPVLVCADLNSLPRSAPHDLVVRGSVNYNHEEFTEFPAAMFEHMKLSHRMRLVSAYSSMLNNTSDILNSKDQRGNMDPATKEPCFTNFTPNFTGAIDYIFYSEGAFTVKRLLELVDRESLKENKALPSPYWPSDHIALMAEFQFKPSETRSYNVRK